MFRSRWQSEAGAPPVANLAYAGPSLSSAQQQSIDHGQVLYCILTPCYNQGNRRNPVNVRLSSRPHHRGYVACALREEQWEKTGAAKK